MNSIFLSISSGVMMHPLHCRLLQAGYGMRLSSTPPKRKCRDGSLPYELRNFKLPTFNYCGSRPAGPALRLFDFSVEQGIAELLSGRLDMASS
jgi:hypothetical protein